MTHANSQSLRDTMVSNQLRTSAVADALVVEAMQTVPREAFVPGGQSAFAYSDAALPLGPGRALNPPLATARLLTVSAPRKGERALVIGSATGYAAALLAEIGLEVTALDDGTVDASSPVDGVTFVTGPLAAGWVEGAPYDLILIDGAVEHVPDVIKAQVRDGGRIAAGVIERGVVRLSLGRKAGNALTLGDVADIDMVTLPGFAVPAGFIF